EEVGLFTMGDVARCSIGKETEFYNEDLLYRLFGINAELLIDHAWGWEPVTMAEIKSYKPETNSLSTGQVLQHPYTFEKARIVAREMAHAMALDLTAKHLVTDQVILTVGYDVENLKDETRRKAYQGEVTEDRYGREVPKHAHGSANLEGHTSSSAEITEAVLEIYDRIMDPTLLVRRLNLGVNRVVDEGEGAKEEKYEQLELFKDYGGPAKADHEEKKEKDEERLQREKRLQQAMVGLQKRYGKNAVLKGTDLEEGATAIERNSQIGGHKA
ncbi:MAG: DNA methylase, partial [Lachnospiraceae bacterium]|nr:DNA methylase [Lachnospiraceae bacterium]